MLSASSLSATDSLDLLLVASDRSWKEEGRNREEVGGCDGSDYFGPRMPFSEGYGPKDLKGASVPFGLTTPKALSAPILVTAVPLSTGPLGHQCSPMYLLHGGAMPVPSLHVVFTE